MLSIKVTTSIILYSTKEPSKKQGRGGKFGKFAGEMAIAIGKINLSQENNRHIGEEIDKATNRTCDRRQRTTINYQLSTDIARD
ncbi:MAG TPA: hypothetical protein DEA78_10970 [Cyanobacteria bacterium UBA11159]|nr:hypothetical protein [Cyanobacteria bacterium UBA11166]HBR74209.1 hypothetical protein [Cyanobacteria bacterium UBA11159]